MAELTTIMSVAWGMEEAPCVNAYINTGNWVINNIQRELEPHGLYIALLFHNGRDAHSLCRGQIGNHRATQQRFLSAPTLQTLCWGILKHLNKLPAEVSDG